MMTTSVHLDPCGQSCAVEQTLEIEPKNSCAEHVLLYILYIILYIYIYLSI